MQGEIYKNNKKEQKNKRIKTSQKKETDFPHLLEIRFLFRI